MASRKGRIVSITARVRGRNGREYTIEIDPEKNDALFWSLGAVDRFLLPSYLVMRGFDYAARLRKDLHAEFNRLGWVLPPHKAECKIVIPKFTERGPSELRI
jgi:hypothetical protein